MGCLEEDLDYAVRCMIKDAKLAIELFHYEGIRDQDGWETLELTVRAEHSPHLAGYILRLLK
jgi:hypothetical protein